MSVVLGDSPLTLDAVRSVIYEQAQVSFSPSAISRIVAARNFVDSIVSQQQVVYGITTGFGSLNNVSIPPESLDRLQKNLILSHAAGMGKPAPKRVVRLMLLLRLACIVNGNSGVRIETAQTLLKALNSNFVPLVPTQGTVGASGDLAPLSHLVAALMGYGKAYDYETRTYVNAELVLNKLGLEPLKLSAKEGLALNNGTQFICANLALALIDAKHAYAASNLIAATTVEALQGTDKAFYPEIHQVKPHPGQISCAETILKYLGRTPEIAAKYTQVQDVYSLRCIPQVHGLVADALKQIETVVVTEMNSSNDNPLIFGDKVLSGGNFHGMYVAEAADRLATVMGILANISERRIDTILRDKSLPNFLVDDAGLNSGFMIIQYAAAGITAENRQLASPACVHNIPTCQNFEDIVSMGGWGSRKAAQSVENTLKVLSLELLTAMQVFECRSGINSPKILQLYGAFRSRVPAVVTDTFMATLQQTALDFVTSHLHKHL